ncbi:MAG: hypothetical protein H0X18_10170, partial [Geodermatophilaceae bacterium]|nr:hypothetical protein [Geodermatophilaceae bacterium]
MSSFDTFVPLLTVPEGQLVQGPLPAGFGPGVEVQLGPVFEGAAAQAGFEANFT